MLALLIFIASASVADCSFERDLNLLRFFEKLVQIAYAQRLSALFPLHKFCSVASLAFKFQACLLRRISIDTYGNINFGSPSCFKHFSFLNFVFHWFELYRKACEAQLCLRVKYEPMKFT